MSRLNVLVRRCFFGFQALRRERFYRSWPLTRVAVSSCFAPWAAEFGLRGSFGRTDLANEAKVAEIVRKSSMY